MPKRIQRKRTKGWKQPNGVVVVTRGTRWGNPFTVSDKYEAGTKVGGFYIAVPTVQDAVECFRLWAADQPDFLESVREELAGKDLACWCKLGAVCHADVLLELANAPKPHPPRAG